MDLKVFVQCDSDTRLGRRLQRDMNERGRDFNSIMTQYMKFVKPSVENFVEPSTRYADVILPNTREGDLIGNSNAVNMLVHHIKHQLESRKLAREASR